MLEIVKIGRVFRVTNQAFSEFMKKAKENVKNSRRKSY